GCGSGAATPKGSRCWKGLAQASASSRRATRTCWNSTGSNLDSHAEELEETRMNTTPQPVRAAPHSAHDQSTLRHSAAAGALPLIRLEAVTKRYRTAELETTALDGVDLDIGQGEFVAVMGPSGCGKSTLLNIIGLIDTPTSGKYWFADREVSRFSEN